MKEKVRIGYWGIEESKNLRITLGKKESMYSTHCHNFYEFEFILSGKGTSMLNGQTYELKRGLAVFVSPTDVHNYISEDKIILYSIRFRLDCVPSDILERFIHVENCIAYLDEQEIGHYVQMCEIIEQEFNQENAYIDGLLACLLIRFSKYFQQKQERPRCHIVIKQAVTYMHSHFKEDPALMDVADMLYMSKSHFCKLFHKEMGISYKNYLRELKLEYAARLLTTTELSSTEVAAESGYGSQAHFCREFVQRYEMSPMAYRKNYKKETARSD